ncbi:helix-turn-helix domain-containing protein [Flavobacterium sp. Sd200]|uniref:helix-turn-helix domain-containing protein n=1 Tax=Flavobacterium sp. Sd200 TaxID=2692211 RepID=UPI00136C3D96|nr:AraC family transcriptional regulator [Flavobacterium sp. Sd200]MXN92024.1 helix-turn-helix domain-containing protein [Flavobacterium sp. Sd200]
MRFDLYSPCAALQPYIKYFAVSEQQEAQNYTVLPGTALVMGFQYRGILSQVEGNRVTALASAGITGLMDTYRVFKNSESIGTVLVYFKETGAANFFKIPLNELFSESVGMYNFIAPSTLENISNSLANAYTDAQRITVIEQFLISQLHSLSTDRLIEEAVRLITLTNGTMRIKELAQKLHISQSPLEKRFRKTVGATAKKFSSIIRIHSLIDFANNGNDIAYAAHNAGYYDQSHFIKDFKTFTGQTPEIFFSEKVK